MKYCISCGQPLSDEARFCANCGTAVKATGYSANGVNENADVEIGISILLNNNNSQESTAKEIYLEHNHKTLAVNIPNGISVGQRVRLRGMGKTTQSGKTGDLFIRIDHIEYKKSAEQQTARKIVYDGELHKCPNCGELLNSFTLACPSCGYELRGTQSSNTISDFASKLLYIESEKQKINLIRNFPIPNTKEDIWEFMILASSNFDANYYVTHMKEDDVSDAWLTKIEQCYQKAKLLFASDAEFSKIQKIYVQINERINVLSKKEKKNTKSHVLLRTIGLWGGILVFIIAFVLDVSSYAETSLYHICGALLMLIGSFMVGRKSEGYYDIGIGITCGVIVLLMGSLLEETFHENGSMMAVAGCLTILIVIIRFLITVTQKKK